MLEQKIQELETSNKKLRSAVENNELTAEEIKRNNLDLKNQLHKEGLSKKFLQEKL